MSNSLFIFVAFKVSQLKVVPILPVRGLVVFVFKQRHCGGCRNLYRCLLNRHDIVAKLFEEQVKIYIFLN